MRRVLVMGLGLLAVAACQKKPDSTAAVGEAPSASASATMNTPPKRKPGLWSQTISTGDMTQTMKLCLDEATEAKMTVWGQQATKNACAKNLVTPAVGGGWTFVSECDMGEAGKIATTGKATGNFNSKYVIKATSVTTGSSMAQSNGTQEMEMTGTWEGACPANMKPGDMTLPNGMTMNIANMAGK